MIQSVLVTSNPTTVAVLDDEPKMRKALCRLLAVHGYGTAEFDRAEEFLASDVSTTADCLLLDLHMPEVSGYDVMDELLRRNSLMAVVVITGHDEPGTEEHVISLGARSYLTKPVDEAALMSAIRLSLPTKFLNHHSNPTDNDET